MLQSNPELRSSNAVQHDSLRASSAFSAARRNQHNSNDDAGGDGDRSPVELSDLEADPDEPEPRTLQPFQQQNQGNPTAAAAAADQTLQGRIQNWQYKVDRVVVDDDKVLWDNGGAGTGRDVYSNNRPSAVPMLSKGLFHSMISSYWRMNICTATMRLYDTYGKVLTNGTIRCTKYDIELKPNDILSLYLNALL